MDGTEQPQRWISMNWLRIVRAAPILGAALLAGLPTGDRATAEPTTAVPVRPGKLPSPPADGVLGFVVSDFRQPVVEGKDACPDGPALKLRDAYLFQQTPAERDRLSRPENEPELLKKWQATAFGEGGTNICSQPELFDHPMLRTVQSQQALGMDLDGGDKSNGCAQPEFHTPAGEPGIDNQEYRVQGCTLEWRGRDGGFSDQRTGMRQFLHSGEWTQVILLRGVDSLDRDDEVEVIYANTPDRPLADSAGNLLAGGTFTISDKPPRNRNVLKGRIVNGVLTTEPADIKLTQTWGQGGARDIRGNRSKWDYRKARLRLTFQPDGTLAGMMGGYRPLFDVIISPALGGAGSALTAGIDCAATLKTLRHFADGLKDSKTGQCQGISSAQEIIAVPAFVNDVQPVLTAVRGS